MTGGLRPRERLWAAARRAGHHLSLRGRSGIWSLGPLGSLWVPGLEPDGSLELTRLAPAPTTTRTYLQRPPRSVRPLPRFEEAWEGEPLPDRVPRVHEVADAHLLGTIGSLVEPRTGRLVAESASDRPTQIAKHQAVKRARVLSPPRRLAGPVVFLPSYDARNYFHFVTDVLTRLFAFSDDGAADLAGFRERTAELEFVLDASGPGFQAAFLELLGLRVRRERLATGTHLAVDRLVLPSFLGLQHPRFGASLFPRESFEWLRRIAREAADASAEQARRLYVTRDSAPTRRVANEAEILALLEARGFERVVPDRLSVGDQVRTFAAAEAIVGPHGAGLANVLWASPSPMVELVSPLHVVPCFYFLADAVGHDYWYLPGDTAPDGPRDFTADFTVDLDALRATLDAAGI